MSSLQRTALRARNANTAVLQGPKAGGRTNQFLPAQNRQIHHDPTEDAEDVFALFAEKTPGLAGKRRKKASSKHRQPEEEEEEEEPPAKRQNQHNAATIPVLGRFSGFDFSREASAEPVPVLKRRRVAESSASGSRPLSESAPPRRPESIQRIAVPVVHDQSSLSLSAAPVIVRRAKRNRSVASAASSAAPSVAVMPKRQGQRQQGKGRRVLNVPNDELGASGFLGVASSSRPRGAVEGGGACIRGASVASSMAGQWTSGLPKQQTSALAPKFSTSTRPFVGGSIRRKGPQLSTTRDEGNVLSMNNMVEDFDPLGRKLQAMTARYRRQDMDDRRSRGVASGVMGVDPVEEDEDEGHLKGVLAFAPTLSIIDDHKTGLNTMVVLKSDPTKGGLVLHWNQRSKGKSNAFKPFSIPVETISSVEVGTQHLESQGLSSAHNTITLTVRRMKISKVTFGFHENDVRGNEVKRVMSALRDIIQ